MKETQPNKKKLFNEEKLKNFSFFLSNKFSLILLNYERKSDKSLNILMKLNCVCKTFIQLLKVLMINKIFIIDVQPALWSCTQNNTPFVVCITLHLIWDKVESQNSSFDNISCNFGQ